MAGAQGVDVVVVPIVPRLRGGVKEGLGSVVAEIGGILHVVARAFQELEGGLEGREFFVLGQRHHHAADGGAGGIGSLGGSIADAAIRRLAGEVELQAVLDVFIGDQLAIVLSVRSILRIKDIGISR